METTAKVTARTGTPPLTQTKDFKSILALCKKARNNALMIGLIADTGMGKTTALEMAARGRNVHYCYVDGTISPKVFLKDLLREMGVPFEGSLNDMLSRLAAELNEQSAPLLILDESAKLSDKMLMLLHSLRDRTMGGCGFVLAGMPDFKNRLIKGVNKGTTGYGEFYRRVNVWHELKGLGTDEITAVLESSGITDAEAQKPFRKLRRFGDLANEILLHHLTNE